MQCRSLLFVLLISCWLLPAPAQAGDFEPDPRSVRRFGPAYRYPQAGWIVLHVEGEPYERGVQHGRLLAPEIAAHVRCFAAVQSPKAPADGWKHVRTLCNSLFLRRYDEEYLKEMKGIADGASAAGARFAGRPIDLLDVVALNSWPEIDTLDSALNATSTGLEGLRFELTPAAPKPAPKPMRCSAFAATGPATRDGKIVFGHITMFALYPSTFYNVWLDVKPSKGHRVLMQSYPAGIQSGMDYYLNDAGLLVAETTLAQTRFEIKGLTVAWRIRQALQYADSIDKAVAILKEQNNGLYTNEWSPADIKTNEIAMFELGTNRSKLWRSGKNEWYGGTEGFYWGCNNTKDLNVRLETLASNDGQPAQATFEPSDRDRMWLKLYDKHKGKIDADFGKLCFTTPPLAAYHSVDAKFTTSALAGELKTWALFGPPLGRTWQPTFEERQKYPEIQPLVSNPWAILHGGAPAEARDKPLLASDLHNPDKSADHLARVDDHGNYQEDKPDGMKLSPRPAWHGTILPTTDADTWLAAGFTAYERVATLEKELTRASGGKLSREDHEKRSLALFAHRAGYELAAKARPEMALADTRSDLRSDEWHRVASGKGVLLLDALRSRMSPGVFEEMMDEFGRKYAGKPCSTADFVAHVEKKAGDKLPGDFFRVWLQEKGLPGLLSLRGTWPAGTSVLGFLHELEQTLIVCGTSDEAPANKEAAEALQQAIRARHSNYTVPIKSDIEVTPEELKSNHLLLIGRPNTNRVVRRIDMKNWPIQFGDCSFTVGDQPEPRKRLVFAHARSAVIAAAGNPNNARFSAVVIAGLEVSATLRAAPYLMEKVKQDAEVVVLPYREKTRLLAVTSEYQTGIVPPAAVNP